MIDEDTQNTREIVCPHCGVEYGDSWELNDHDGTEQNCQECGKKFLLQVYFDVTYSTKKI